MWNNRQAACRSSWNLEQILRPSQLTEEIKSWLIDRSQCLDSNQLKWVWGWEIRVFDFIPGSCSLSCSNRRSWEVGINRRCWWKPISTISDITHLIFSTSFYLDELNAVVACAPDPINSNFLISIMTEILSYAFPSHTITPNEYQVILASSVIILIKHSYVCNTACHWARSVVITRFWAGNTAPLGSELVITTGKVWIWKHTEFPSSHKMADFTDAKCN